MRCFLVSLRCLLPRHVSPTSAYLSMHYSSQRLFASSLNTRQLVREFRSDQENIEEFGNTVLELYSSSSHKHSQQPKSIGSLQVKVRAAAVLTRHPAIFSFSCACADRCAEGVTDPRDRDRKEHNISTFFFFGTDSACSHIQRTFRGSERMIWQTRDTCPCGMLIDDPRDYANYCYTTLM